MKKTVILLLILLFTVLAGKAGAESLMVSAMDPIGNQTKAAPELIDVALNADDTIRGEGWNNQSFLLTNGNEPDSVSEMAVVQSPSPTKVPEPATMLLLGIGLTAMASFGRRVLKK